MEVSAWWLMGKLVQSQLVGQREVSPPSPVPFASACNQSCSLLWPCRRTDRWRAKYELLHVVRTHMGQDDAHYG